MAEETKKIKETTFKNTKLNVAKLDWKEVYYTNCPLISASNVDQELGWTKEEYKKLGISYLYLRSRAENDWYPHYIHNLDNLIRFGGLFPPIHVQADIRRTRLLGVTHAPREGGDRLPHLPLVGTVLLADAATLVTCTGGVQFPVAGELAGQVDRHPADEGPLLGRADGRRHDHALRVEALVGEVDADAERVHLAAAQHGALGLGRINPANAYRSLVGASKADINIMHGVRIKQ